MNHDSIFIINNLTNSFSQNHMLQKEKKEKKELEILTNGFIYLFIYVWVINH